MSEINYKTQLEDRSSIGFAHPEAERVWGGIPDKPEDAPTPGAHILADDSLTLEEKQANHPLAGRMPKVPHQSSPAFLPA